MIPPTGEFKPWKIRRYIAHVNQKRCHYLMAGLNPPACDLDNTPCVGTPGSCPAGSFTPMILFNSSYYYLLEMARRRGDERMVKELEELDRDAPEVPQVGTTVKMEIISIKAGKLEEFITADSMDKWENADADDPYVEITAISEDKKHGTTNLVSNPEALSPYHKLTKFINAFGKPKVGNMVPYTYSAKGRWEFAGI